MCNLITGCCHLKPDRPTFFNKVVIPHPPTLSSHAWWDTWLGTNSGGDACCVIMFMGGLFTSWLFSLLLIYHSSTVHRACVQFSHFFLSSPLIIHPAILLSLNDNTIHIRFWKDFVVWKSYTVAVLFDLSLYKTQQCTFTFHSYLFSWWHFSHLSSWLSCVGYFRVDHCLISIPNLW